MKLAEHPTVRRVRAKERLRVVDDRLSAAWLREIALECGADDVGFVSIDRPEIADQRDDILAAFPGAKTLVSYVVRMNEQSIRSPARSIANLEFHHTGDETNDVARRVLERLRERGVGGVNPAMGFPMEMDRFPGKIWVVSHKPVAVAAGLGAVGIHRNVIHPKFGNFILLGTVVIDAPVDDEGAAVDFNPCLECKLCVAACPVGAIAPTGEFDFSACYTHNYREFMGGFTDWVERVAESDSREDYRERVDDGESASMWQSLSFGANYKAAYCMAVCPAGEDVIGPFLDDRKNFLETVVDPLKDKHETVYVLPNSDAKKHVEKRFSNKTTKTVLAGLRPTSVEGLLSGMKLTFQRGQAAGLDAVYHFTFTGKENLEATFTIRDRSLTVERGHVGKPNVRVRADSETWVGFIRRERNLLWAILTLRVRVRGPLRLMKRFGECFAG